MIVNRGVKVGPGGLGVKEGGPVLLVVVGTDEGVENHVLGSGEKVAAVVGKGKHSGPRPIPAIPELAPNPVKVLS